MVLFPSASRIVRARPVVRMDAGGFVCPAVIWARLAMRRVDNVRDARPIVRVGNVVRTAVGGFACLAVLWARPVMRRVGSVRYAHRIVMGVSVVMTDVGQVVVTVRLTQAVWMEFAFAILSTATGFVVSPVRSATPEAVAAPTARVETAARTAAVGPVGLVAVWVKPAMRRAGSVKRWGLESLCPSILLLLRWARRRARLEGPLVRFSTRSL